MTDVPDDRAVADKLHLEVQLLLLDCKKRSQDILLAPFILTTTAMGAGAALLAAFNALSHR